MKQTILMTGSSGFIGSNLTKKLRDGNNYRVLGIDLREPVFFEPDDFELLDILDQAKLERVIQDKKPTCILHLAAVSTIQKGLENSDHTRRVNVEGTRSVLNAAEKSGCNTRVVYVSTDKVYGPMDDVQKYTEEMRMNPLPNSPYDVSKAEADRLVQSFGSRLPVTILRLCNIYGPYDTHLERIVPANVRAMLSGRPGRLNCYRDNEGCVHDFYRDMLYVDDLCEAFSSLMRLLGEDGDRLCGQIFNIGAMECVSMRRVMEEIQRNCGCALAPEINYVEATNELKMQSMDFEKARRDLGFSPKTTLEIGIQKTVDWWRQAGDVIA